MVRLSNASIAVVILTAESLAQLAGTGISIPRQINGQVRLDSRAAPQGVLVLLDFASAGGSGVPGRGELGRTATDSSGRFVFDRLETVGGRSGKERFALTAHFAGYRDAFEVVDLTFLPRAFVTIEMHPEPSHDSPNVPPGGPGEAISAHQPSSPEAQSAMAKAQQELVRDRNPRASLGEFRKVARLDPQYEPAYFWMGTAYMQLREYEEAESAFAKATKLEPNDAAAFLGIGASLNQRGDFSRAQKPLLHSLELNPNYIEAHCELGRSLWALGKWQEAEPHARRSLELDRNYALAHLLMGNIYLRKRDANSSLSEFQEYLRLDPEGPYAEAAKQMVVKIQNALGRR
jgi:Flp pilus assembly protein TadD